MLNGVESRCHSLKQKGRTVNKDTKNRLQYHIVTMSVDREIEGEGGRQRGREVDRGEGTDRGRKVDREGKEEIEVRLGVRNY